MMSSLTAYRMLVASSVSISGHAKPTADLALGWGMTEAMLKRWFVRQGFRGDGDRCAWKRWLQDWIDSGLAVTFSQDDGARGVWWTEIGTDNYTTITMDAEHMQLDHFYRGDGELHVTAARRLGVMP